MIQSRVWEKNVWARALSFNPIFLFDLAISFFHLPQIKNWHTLLLDHLRWQRHQQIVLEWRDGARMRLRPRSSDGWTVQETILTDYYRLDRLHLTNANVLDLGANIGAFSIAAAARFPQSRIFAYEPEPDNFKMLCANIALNGFEARISPRRLGCSGDNDGLLLNVTDNAAGHSHYWAGEETIRVPTVSLKSIMEREGISQCDLLKMDVEGSEYETLYAADAETLEKISRLYIEYHNIVDVRLDFQAQPLARHLRARGFCVEQFAINRTQGYLYCEREEHQQRRHLDC